MAAEHDETGVRWASHSNGTAHAPVGLTLLLCRQWGHACPATTSRPESFEGVVDHRPSAAGDVAGGSWMVKTRGRRAAELRFVLMAALVRG